MQSVTEEGGAIGRRQPDPIVSNPVHELVQKEKKVILQFRHGKVVHPSCVPGVRIVEEPMPRCQKPSAQPVQPAGDDLLLTSICDRCEPATPDQFGTSFRVFKDRIGKCWRCLMPLTCSHAIVMHGAIHSCRVRTSQINDLEKAAI